MFLLMPLAVVPNPNRLIRLEFIVILSFCWEWYSCGSRFAAFAWWEVALHRAFVLAYALIATAGAHAAILFCAANDRFLEVFKAENLLGIPANWMCWIAALHGLAGLFLMFFTFPLNRFGKLSRRVAPLLAIPCAAVYPLVMANLMNVVHFFKPRIDTGSVIAAFTFAALFGVWFYWFSTAAEKMKPKAKLVFKA